MKRVLLIEKMLTMKSITLLREFINDPDNSYISKRDRKTFMKQTSQELKYMMNMNNATKLSNGIYI